MKQLIQYFKTGNLELIDAPVPKANPNSIVIKSTCSLISVGTEKMLINFGKASLLQKAKQQPDKVKQVVDKIKTDGLISTLEAVKSKLNEPTPIGYSNVGIVVEKDEFVTEFTVGDRVVSNGPHAEYVKVPWTLAAKVPENVIDDDASFTVLGSIAMEGVRLIQPTLGETIVVIGLGLIGQLTLQILQANGCHVIGLDIDKSKVDLAKSLGVDSTLSGSTSENVKYILGASNGIGADGVIITASTTSEEILSQAALMCRKRGRIVLVGVVPITVPRNLFYEKELSFQVSSAYGPGRYDPIYEEKGIDYPLPYVRWTAKRNMEAFLFLLSQGKLDVGSLITHRFKFEDAVSAYQSIDNENPLGIILEYMNKKNEKIKIIDLFETSKDEKTLKENKLSVIGLIGAGNFAKMMLLPALKNANANIKMISDSNGYSSVITGKKYGALQAVSDTNEIFKDNEINTVFIATRHSSHASLVRKSIESEKNVFVEKPLAIRFEELKEIYQIIKKHDSVRLMVGFNRRFSPFSEKLQKKLANRSDPISIIITVNAGAIPINHWVHDPEVGGGRIIGEGCHFIDLARFLVGHPITTVSVISTVGHSQTDEDKAMWLMSFQDGSQAAIHYLANGNKKYPKERVEVFSSERVFVIENFKHLHAFGDSMKLKKLKQDKGHREEVKRFIESVNRGLPSPISLDEIFEIHLVTLAVRMSLEQKKSVSISELWTKLQK